MRALIGRATAAELAVVAAWTAASPDNARQSRELQQMLAEIAAWYGATPARPPPTAEALLWRARLRTRRGSWSGDE